MARLAIRGLRTKVSIGCKDEERAYPRIAELDIVVHYDMGDAIGGDSIELGVDYNQIAAGVERMCTGQSWKLIETFAADVGRMTLGLNERVLEVDVCVRREVMTAAQTVEVTLTMDRKGQVR